MIHVESIYVMNPRFTELFESFPGRQLETLSGSIKADSTLSALVRDGFAAPVLEYAYLVAGRSDLIGGRDVATLSWKDFWDIENIQGGRGLRDFPVGNIEAALASLGHDPRTYLYAETDPAKLRFKLDEALARLTRLLPAVIWWKTGDKLQQGLESGDMTLAGAWSGRVLAAFRVRCPAAKQLTDCPIGANPNTALISTDWWIIPKGVAGKDNANRLLVELFAPRNRGNAAEFAARQGYSVPISEHNPKDPIAKYFLELGSSDNSKATRLDEKFWGRSFDDINRIWLEWRARS
jgi:putative spermidine/putrescine transport system substrate-binding protein